MKAVIAALVLVLAACDRRPAAEPGASAGTSAPAGSGPGALAASAPQTSAPIEPAPAERVDAIDAGPGDRLAAAATDATRLEKLCTTLRAMDDQVTKLSALGPSTSHAEECKEIRELEKQAKSLPGTDHGVVDMAIEDIVDGRCGARAIGRREDFRDFYEEVHKSLGRMRSTCDRP